VIEMRAKPAAERVSVVIPAYNASAYLPATLRSIFDQSCPPGEIIVVDDGSTDDTVEVARAFDVRVIAVSNRGPSAARNIGMRSATGEYVAFLDADDLWTPQKLAVQCAALRSYARPAFSFTDYRVFDDRTVHTHSSGLRQHPAFRAIARRAKNVSGRRDIVVAADGKHPVLYESYIQPSSVLVRLADAFAVGGWDETLRMSEDQEFFLRLFKILPAVGVMQSLLLYRRHAAQATAKSTAIMAGYLNVARCVAAAPYRYPVGDGRYIAASAHRRYYRLGIEQARLAQFDAAARSFGESLKARRTLRAGVALLGSQFCARPVGRRLFAITRRIVKFRPRAKR
jgi:glycosyltransferase involved in cell wall biosynthesis